MTHRRLIGERVAVKVPGGSTRDGVLISGIAKPTKTIQTFPVRFPNGDVRTYRGDQLLLRGSQAPPLEFIRVGDIIYTKTALGVVRFIGLHEDFSGIIIVLEPIDPKLPSDPDIESFRKLFPSANLSDHRAYIILRQMEDILKILPPPDLLQQLSKIKDKYLAYVEDSREKQREFEQVMSKWAKKIEVLESEIEQENQDMKEPESSSEVGDSQAPEDSDLKDILFQPGRIGVRVTWTTGRVDCISPRRQSEMRGVKPGWVIVKIDEEEFSRDLLRSKMNGDKDYILTFKMTSEKAETFPFSDMLTRETERGSYERKIQELTEQLQDFQYLLEDLQNKNIKLGKDQENLPKLREKVVQLRASRVLFKSQIKEFEKRFQKAKQKADFNEKKYKDYLLEFQSGKKNASQAARTTKDGAKQGRKHVRKPSVSMPKPDASNTVSLATALTPKTADGSAETVSLSSLRQQSTKLNVSNSKNIKKSDEETAVQGWKALRLTTWKQ